MLLTIFYVGCLNEVPALQPAAQCFLELGVDSLFLSARSNMKSGFENSQRGYTKADGSQSHDSQSDDNDDNDSQSDDSDDDDSQSDDNDSQSYDSDDNDSQSDDSDDDDSQSDDNDSQSDDSDDSYSQSDDDDSDDSDEENEAKTPRILQNQASKSVDLEKHLEIADFFENQFENIDDIDVGKLDAEQCKDIFGMETNLELFSCLLLLDPADVVDFDDFIEDEIDNSRVCQDLAFFLGEDEARDFLDDILFAKAGEVFDDELGTFDHEEAKNKLVELNAVIETCSEYDNTVLKELSTSFESSGNLIKGSLMSVAFALLIGFGVN